MSELASTPPHAKKTTIPRILLSHMAGADIADRQSATGWKSRSVRAALSGLRKTGHSINHVHFVNSCGTTNCCIASNPGRTQ